MRKPRIILIGGGGHCKSCIDVIEQEDKFEIAGIVDINEKIGQPVLNYQIIATDDDLERLSKEYKFFFITIGQLKNPEKRILFFDILKKLGVTIPFIMSPKSYVSKYAVIGDGTIIMHNVVVNAGAFIGKNCIINSQSLIEHDAEIGNYCHISTGTIINGNCVIGDNVFIGSGAILINGVKVCNDVTIGAGSLAIKDIAKRGVYFGSPIKLKHDE